MTNIPDRPEMANEIAPPGENELSASEVQSPEAGEGRVRLATWVQLPRRIILTLIAYGVAAAFIGALPGLGGPFALEGVEVDWTVSLMTSLPVADVIGERLPNTLLLLGAALFLALLMALAAALAGVLVHKVEANVGSPGSVLKGLGRLWIFSQATLPVFAVGLFLIYIFALRLKLLPPSGMVSLTGEGGLAGRLRHLILPTFTLALLPAALTAQAMARELTLPRERGGYRDWLRGLLKGLGTLVGQIGGLLSAIVLVEVVFLWPGLGRLTSEAAMTHDTPVLLGVLRAFAGLILAGRLVAEFFRWLGRLVSLPASSVRLEPTSRRKTARKTWAIAALALLLIPLGFTVAGLTVTPDSTQESDLGAVDVPPSADHPWGTDGLGRDLRARVLRGGLVTLGIAAAVAAITVLPGGLTGGLIGFLASRRALWAESVADLLLLPADVLLFIPAVPAVIVITTLLGPDPGLTLVVLATVAVLLPRTVRAAQTLWTAAPAQRRRQSLGLAGLGALFLGALFAGLWLVAGLDFLGFGVQPPLPSLGSVLSDAVPTIHLRPEGLFASGSVLWLSTFACYTAADALVGFFHSKEVMARMNE